MAGQRITLLLASSLAWSAPTLAREDVPAREGDLACSSLCRSWMSLGQASATPDAAQAVPAAAVAATAAPVAAPAPRSAAPSKTGAGGKPSRAATLVAVPLPPRRPPAAQPTAARPLARSDVSATPAAAFPALEVAVAVPAPVPPPVPAPAPLPAPAVAAPPLPAVPGNTAVLRADLPAPSVRAGPPPASPHDDTAHRAVAPRPAPATPIGVKLGIYAALAATVVWFFRPRPVPGPQAGPPAARAVRRRPSARVQQDVPQHAAVDAL